MRMVWGHLLFFLGSSLYHVFQVILLDSNLRLSVSYPLFSSYICITTNSSVPSRYQSIYQLSFIQVLRLLGYHLLPFINCLFCDDDRDDDYDDDNNSDDDFDYDGSDDDNDDGGSDDDDGDDDIDSDDDDNYCVGSTSRDIYSIYCRDNSYILTEFTLEI